MSKKCNRVFLCTNNETIHTKTKMVTLDTVFTMLVLILLQQLWKEGLKAVEDAMWATPRVAHRLVMQCYTVLHITKHCCYIELYSLCYKVLCVLHGLHCITILQTFSTTQAGVQESNGQKCGGRYDKISGESLTLWHQFKHRDSPCHLKLSKSNCVLTNSPSQI